MTSLLLFLLSAAPLEVRVLEREVPVRVHLEAARISCDGKPLGTSINAEASVREVKVGEARCTQMIAKNSVAVTVCAGVERAYWLFSHRNTMGSVQTPARFIASYKQP